VKEPDPRIQAGKCLGEVVGLSEEREITSKFRRSEKLVEATVGDETATVLLTLWNDQIGQVQKDETVLVDKRLRDPRTRPHSLNVANTGRMAKSDQTI